MAYTTEAIEAPRAFTQTSEPNQFDLPVKEFIGYDPKGKTDITGSPIIRDTSTQNTTQTNTVETAPPTEGAVEETITLSPKISALARKEAAQRQREQALKQRERSLSERLAKAEKYEQLQAKIAAKDYSAADELGLSYEEFTNYLLNKQAGEKPEEQRHRKMEQELSEIKKAQEEKINSDYRANQALWRQEISKVVKDNEAFPEINFAGAEAISAVLQHINESFDEDDVELSAEQAAQDIEKYLAERALKFSESPTVKQKFSATEKVLGPPKTTGVKTITQNMTVTSQQTKPKPFHLMSESEQIAEAFRRVQAARQQR